MFSDLSVDSICLPPIACDPLDKKSTATPRVRDCPQVKWLRQQQPLWNWLFVLFSGNQCLLVRAIPHLRQDPISAQLDCVIVIQTETMSQ